MAFVSSEYTSSTNEAVNNAHEVSTANSQGQASFSSYADDVMFSFFIASQQLDSEDLEQIDTNDLEEIDLKWQRTCQFHQSSDSEVSTCSKACLKSYESLKEHFDKQKEQLKKSNLEIIGYQLGLESLEARIVVHEKNEASYEESIAFLKYDVQVKDISIKNLKNQLEEALKEKDDLKLKLENFEESSKNLTKLINSQISVKDKTGLGFDSHVNESEVLDNVVDSHECNQVNDRFKKSEGYHAVPLPFTGKFKPAKADLSFTGLDGSVYKSKVMPPIIEDWESDSEDENVFEPKEVKKIVKSSFEKIEFVNARNSTVEKPRKFSQNPRDNKRNGNSFEFTKKACFVKAVLTKSGIVPISATRQSSSRAAAPASAARPVNTAAPKPFMNVARPRPKCLFHKVLNFVNTAKGNKVTSAVGNNGLMLLSPQHAGFWRTKGNLLHMGLFRPVSVRSINRKSYCLVVTDDFSRFSWVFFLATKDETPEILKNFITGIENKSDHKGIKGNLSVARTSHKNGRKPALNFMRPFGCPIIILNTLDHLGKFDGKSDDRFFVGYSINSKAFRVFNTRTRFVEENMHINFLENKPNVVGTRPNWMFDIDTLTMSMNYQPVFVGNQTNGNAGPKSSNDEVADDAGKKNEAQDLTKEGQEIKKRLLENNLDKKLKDCLVKERLLILTTLTELILLVHQLMMMFTPVNAGGSSYENIGGSILVNAATFPNDDFPTDPRMPDLEDTADLQVTGIFSSAYDNEDVGAEADLNNLETTMNVIPIPTTRIHKDHPKEQIIGDINSATQTRRMIKKS
ncbi:ribonuclease H-like domain-containing protein [Tanacetum coccineum]